MRNLQDIDKGAKIVFLPPKITTKVAKELAIRMKELFQNRGIVIVNSMSNSSVVIKNLGKNIFPIRTVFI